MALINDIDTVRANGVNVMFTNNTSSIADMTAAEERFLLPILGDTLYNSLLAGTDLGDSGALMKKVQRALAPLAYWLDLPNIQTQITDNGVATFNTENMQSAHRWEFEYIRNNLEDKGCYALERLLQFLSDNKDTYSWSLPTPYKIAFLTGTQFFNYFPVFQPHRTFLSLRPLVKQAEDQYLRTLIGDTYFEELRDKADPTDDEKKVIELMKSALANLTIKIACEVLPVKISQNGFTVRLNDATDKENVGEALAPDSQLGSLYKSVERTGQTYLSRMKDYLNTNASAEKFATFFNSSYYVSPETKAAEVNPNSTRVIFRLP